MMLGQAVLTRPCCLGQDFSRFGSDDSSASVSVVAGAAFVRATCFSSVRTLTATIFALEAHYLAQRCTAGFEKS
jgi:hypothetical protein